MDYHSRRAFLADVGRGMLVAGLGAATAIDLGLAPAAAAEEAGGRLTFGANEPLVEMMQQTPLEKLLPEVVAKLKAGVALDTLVAAAALANARAFGGQDYTGFHTFMALVPALQMSRELPQRRRALPVLKVLYRNTSRIHEQNAATQDVLHPVSPIDEVPPAGGEGAWLRDAVHRVDWEGAEARFAALARGPVGEAFNHVQYCVQDEVDVHRVVLAWRAWAMLDVAGKEHAHTLLRQSVRYCLNVEQSMRDRDQTGSEVRKVLPRLIDEYHLLSKPAGQRQGDDAWVEHLAQTIFSGTRAQAAEAAAAALAEGFDAEAIGEAISLAANLLVLHDPGRQEKYSSAQKPPGCVHGDSVGVHASDAANAWRNISRVSNRRNQVASLLVGAYHTAGQMQWVTTEPYPYAARLDEVRAGAGAMLLGQAEEAIRGNDQSLACAVMDRYTQQGHPARAAFDLLLKYAVSEDGALHAEKYYRTATEEYAAMRPTFRPRQLVALARVTASEFGFPAPGFSEARELLGVA